MLQGILTTLRQPHIWARFQLLRDLKSYHRLYFYYAADDLGLLPRLKNPTSRAKLNLSMDLWLLDD